MSQPLDSAASLEEQSVPAATVIVFRHAPGGGEAEILLVERSASLNFAGGATVFPGGKVDAADRALALESQAAGLSWAQGIALEDIAARLAAMREALEETGLVVGLVPVDGDASSITAAQAAQARSLLARTGLLGDVLAQLGWQPDPARLVPWARWWPRGKPGRIFDTRFYLADLGTGAVDLLVDATENGRLFWASARHALDLADQGAIQVIFPTRRNLERLAQFADFAGCRDHAESLPPATISPRTIMRDGVPWLTIPAGHGYPVLGEPLGVARRG